MEKGRVGLGSIRVGLRNDDLHESACSMSRNALHTSTSVPKRRSTRPRISFDDPFVIAWNLLEPTNADDEAEIRMCMFAVVVLIVGEPETFLVMAGLELGYHEGVYRGGTDVLLPAAHTAVRAPGR